MSVGRPKTVIPAESVAKLTKAKARAVKAEQSFAAAVAELDQEMVDAAEAGVPISQIHEITGASRATIYRAIRRTGS